MFDSFFGTYIAILLVLFSWVAIPLVVAHSPTAEELSKRCAEHRGVAQVTGGIFSVVRPVLICRDGTVTRLDDR